MKISAISNMNFSANKMSQKQANYFKDRMKNAHDANIVCHEMTDRDSLNSAIAMQRYLNTLGVNSTIILSQNLKKLGITEPFFDYIQANKIDENDEAKDTSICVDFSAKERLAPNVLNYIQKSPNVLCIDHHRGTNLFSDNCVILKKPIENADKVIESASSCYVDSSAKSATSIIYRMFEALDEPIDNPQAYSLMYGFADDSTKRGLLVCDGEKGEIKPSKKLIDDKNAYEIYNALKEKLTDEQIERIASSIDILANLTPLENKFKDSLKDKLRLSDNKKIAYVEIPPDDTMWHVLGADNSRTSTILNRFRQSVLRNDFKDSSLDDVELAFVFYQAEDKYRISAHSKNSVLLDFYDYVEQNKIPEFTKNAGGHQDRGGGKIFTIDPKTCHKWVQDIISCQDFFSE